MASVNISVSVPQSSFVLSTKLPDGSVQVLMQGSLEDLQREEQLARKAQKP